MTIQQQQQQHKSNLDGIITRGSNILVKSIIYPNFTKKPFQNISSERFIIFSLT